MPEEGLAWLPRPEVLTFEEITRFATVCASTFGVNSLRLTGGEPTMRANISDLVASLAEIRDAETGEPIDLAMTTNGATLRKLAPELKEAGLRRINISLDTLDHERFVALTRRDQLTQVLDGIEAAIEAGFHPIKLNAVAMRGVNDDELVDLAAYARDRGLVLRLIEYMPLDADGNWSDVQVLTADEIVARITSRFPATEISRTTDPATRYVYEDGKGEFGVIASVTKAFCDTCDRIRLTADGKIRTCLFALDEHDVKALMRSGGDDAALAAAIERAVGTKWAGHSISNVNFIRPNRSMSQIGG